MPATLQRKRIRLQIFADKDDPIKDQMNGATPSLWRGNDVQFELGIFWNDLIATDITNLASITLDLRVTNALGALAATKTIVAAAFEAVTDATWADKTAQHAKVTFTGTEMNLDLSSAVSKNYWLVVSAITTDSPTRAITLGATTLTMKEDGAGSAGSPPTNDPLYYTIGQTDALFAKLAPADGTYRVVTNGNGAFLQLWNPDQAKWHSIWVVGAAGAERINLGPGES